MSSWNTVAYSFGIKIAGPLELCCKSQTRLIQIIHNVAVIKVLSKIVILSHVTQTYSNTGLHVSNLLRVLRSSKEGC